MTTKKILVPIDGTERSMHSLNFIKEQTMEILMDGYIRTLFRLVLSDKQRETIIQCMEMIGKIYEVGIVTLMQKENHNGNQR